ncbi:MAG TPA: hypothetical protein VHV30_05885 [Polyangiaceae bacterium]|nr:hypothetical protein [Polyangiaceae bacterium]
MALAGAAAAACSSSSSPATTSSDDSGTDAGSSSGSTSSGSSSGTSSSSSGSSGGSSSGSSSGGTEAGTTTLYQTLGGHAGVRAAVHAIVVAELADTDIQTYFFNQVQMNPGHPTATQIEECFTDLVSANIGGTETYPYTVGPFDDAGVNVGDGGAGTGTFTCRDMTAIHAPLKISGGTFDKFVTIAAGVLMGSPYNLTSTSSAFTTLAGLLTGQKAPIVDPNLADAGAGPFDANAP